MVRSRVIVISLSGVLLGGALRVATRPAVESLELNATEQWNNGQVEASEALARNILARHPASERALSILEQVAAHDGDALLTAAVKLSRQEQTGNLYLGYLQAAQVVFQNHYAAVAEHLWSQAIQLHPDRPEAYQSLTSLAAMRLENERLSALLFQQIEQFGPTEERLKLLLNGETLDRDAKQLLELLEQFLAADPSDLDSRIGVARCLIALGQPEEAIRVLEITNPSVEAQIVYVRALIEIGELDQALQQLKTISLPEPSGDLLFSNGLIALRSGELSEAVTLLGKAVELRPLNREIRSVYLDALRRQESEEEIQKQSADLERIQEFQTRLNNPTTVLTQSVREELLEECQAIGAKRYVQAIQQSLQ